MFSELTGWQDEVWQIRGDLSCKSDFIAGNISLEVRSNFDSRSREYSEHRILTSESIFYIVED